MSRCSSQLSNSVTHGRLRHKTCFIPIGTNSVKWRQVMYSYKKIISILKKDWLDYILLLFLSILLVLIAHSFSIIVLEFNDSVHPEGEASEITLPL